MRRQTSTVRIGGPALVAALVCTAFLLWSGWAHSDVPRYEATVPLGAAKRIAPVPWPRRCRQSQSKPPVAVVPRRMGPVAAANPARYVQRYAKTADQMLKVGFDGPAVEELLQQAGLPLWPSERPVTVVTATAVVSRWTIVPRSSVPQPGGDCRLPGLHHLRPRRVGRECDADRGTRRHRVRLDVHALGGRTEARGTAQDGIHLAADTLAAYYAPPSTRSTSSLSVSVGGMRDFTAYTGLIDYLKSLSLVRDVAVEALTGDVVQLRLAVRGDRELLADRGPRWSVAAGRPQRHSGRRRRGLPVPAMSLRSLPNLLCVLRILMVYPVAHWILTGRYPAVMALFALAAFTDALDGFLAKRFDWTSELGKLLDPLADKLLLVTVFMFSRWSGSRRGGSPRWCCCATS